MICFNRGLETDVSHWRLAMLDQVRERLVDDQSWAWEMDPAENASTPAPSVHLAVFVEPYLQFILDGKKTVESRFSTNRCAPYGVVQAGDLVLLKRSGGPIEGICQVADVWSYRLDPRTWDEIRRGFGTQLCITDAAFWSARSKATYATLMRIGRAERLRPITVDKRDRRGWVLIWRQSEQRRMPACDLAPSSFGCSRTVSKPHLF
jgi:hypothetical protein